MSCFVLLTNYYIFTFNLADAFIQRDEHSYSVDSATGSHSGLSVLLKGTTTRAGIEPPTP